MKVADNPKRDNMVISAGLFDSKKVMSVVANRSDQYDVQFVPNLLEGGHLILVETLGNRSGLLICTPTVAKLYGKRMAQLLADAGLSFPLVVLDIDEAGKDLSAVEKICRAAIDHQLDRESVLIGMGGGVCTDVVTLAASLFRRGIATLRIPTTFVGQIDASVGIKGAVNHLNAKSRIGCFHAPMSVIIDPTFLRTLPPRHMSAGFSESLKMAILKDDRLFELVESHGRKFLSAQLDAGSDGLFEEILRRSVCGMLEELQDNFYEDQSLERLVDFGHTFSPLIEVRSEYSLTHGGAVAIDMACSSAIAVELGILSEENFDRITGVLKALELPTCVAHLTIDLMVESMEEQTRHRGGSLNLVVPVDIGRAVFVRSIDELPSQLLENALRRLSEMTYPKADGRGASRQVDSRRSQQCEESRLVFEVGGTTIRAGVLNSRNQITSVLRESTPNFESMPAASYEEIYESLIAKIESLGERVLPGQVPASVGLAFPGPLDGFGRIVAAPTIWRETPVQKIDLPFDLQRLWPDSNIHVLNDVSAAGYRYLDGRDFCILTVGSGIGNKVFIDGTLRTGASGRGGEMGHAQVDFSPDACRCDCGGTGHLGSIASGRGTLAAARSEARKDPTGFNASVVGKATKLNPQSIDNRVLVSAFRQGDEWATKVVNQAAKPLGSMLANLHVALGLERFVVVGGFALAMGEKYRRCLVQSASEACWNVGQQWDSMIELGIDDDNSGLIGTGVAMSMKFDDQPLPKLTLSRN